MEGETEPVALSKVEIGGLLPPMCGAYSKLASIQNDYAADNLALGLRWM